MIFKGGHGDIVVWSGDFIFYAGHGPFRSIFGVKISFSFFSVLMVSFSDS